MQRLLKHNLRVPLFSKLVALLSLFSIFPLFLVTVVVVALEQKFFWPGILTLCGLSGVIFAAALLLARHMTRPIQALMVAAERITKGDFSIFVDVTTHDELQDLAEAFNRMSEGMRSYSEIQVDEVMSEKAKTEGVIYSSEDAILMTDEEGKVVLVNPKARNLLELGDDTLNHLTGRPIWSFVKNDHLAVALREGIEGDAPKSTRIIDMSKDTLRRFFTLSTSLVNAPEGSATSYWIVLQLRNITAEKELDQLKDDFLQSLTHDLRSPMTAVRGYLQVLSEEMAGPINAEQRKMLRIMENASTKLLHIISNLLDSAKISAGKLRLSLTETDLRQLIPPTVEIMHSEAAKKKITLTLDMPEQMAALNIDPPLLERVMINLISNAIKFTPDGGFVTVKFVELKDRIQGQVIDNGPGIPKEFIDRLFKKFEQVNGTRGGTGLGLSNCKNILEAHFGQISVASKVGEGSTFTFWIPRDLEQNEKSEVYRTRSTPLSAQEQQAA